MNSHLSVVAAIVVAVCCAGCGSLMAQQAEKDRIVMAESTSWDAEANRFKPGPGADLRWEQTKQRGTVLTATNNASLRVLATKKFQSLSVSHLSRVKYLKERIPASRLSPGTVVAMRTSAGNFVKLRVIESREAVDGKILEFEWALYKAPYKTTVLLGTWTWDIETNQMGQRPGVDLFWQQVNARRAILTPMNGAAVKIVDQEFSTFSEGDLARLEFPKTSIAKADLRPGTVVAIRTSAGNFGKLRVKQYRTLHDTSFPEAKYLSDRWKKFVLGQPNKEEYHLEVQWMLFGEEAVASGNRRQAKQ